LATLVGYFEREPLADLACASITGFLSFISKELALAAPAVDRDVKAPVRAPTAGGFVAASVSPLLFSLPCPTRNPLPPTRFEAAVEGFPAVSAGAALANVFP
jgi:hypothetical protein